ncbi:hypothetical protein ACWIDS_18735 [Dietzia maris]
MDNESNLKLRQQLGIAGRAETRKPQRGRKKAKSAAPAAEKKSPNSGAATGTRLEAHPEGKDADRRKVDSPELNCQRKLARDELRGLNRRLSDIDRRLEELRTERVTKRRADTSAQVALLNSRKTRFLARKRAVGRWLAQNSPPRSAANPAAEKAHKGKKKPKTGKGGRREPERNHRGLDRNLGVATGSRGVRPRASLIG